MTPPSATKVFGDYPYGLELLRLPPLDRLEEDQPGGDPASPLVAAEALADALAAPAASGWGQPDLVERLFWFRWMVGHQLSFVLWRALGRVLRSAVTVLEAESGRDLDDELACRAVALTEGYSAVLVYSATCTRALYDDVIRRAMRLQHRSFSGQWSAEHAPLPRLATRLARAVPRGDSRPGARRVVEAYRENARVHTVVGRKLVPGGVTPFSVFQDYAGPREQIPASAVHLFDAVFLTLRCEVSSREICVQFLRRLAAMFMDLSSQGLYPGLSSSAHERSAELLTAPLDRYERDQVPILCAAASATAWALLPGDEASVVEPLISRLMARSV